LPSGTGFEAAQASLVKVESELKKDNDCMRESLQIKYIRVE
jgi:hypothetical protein